MTVNTKKNKNELLFDTPGWSITTSSAHLTSKPIKKIKSTSQSTSNLTSKPENPSKKKRKLNPTIQEPNQLNPSSSELVQNLISSNLSGSRFRLLNETLYTSTGPEALKLFTNETSNHPTNPNFISYHQGFKSQTKNWPQNPVKIIANQLKKQYEESLTDGIVIVADLGCGEAPLAKLLCDPSLKQDQKSKLDKNLEFRVMSYDLVTDSDGWVIKAECSTNVPLPGSQSDQIDNGMIDVVVCCLSLMGTNWVGMILEARRILKQGGQLKIAEVTSRFIDINKFIDFIKLIGFSTPTQDQSNTHFILFEFKKSIRKNPIQLKMNSIYDQPDELDQLIKRGEKLLKPCLYKRR